MEKFCILQAFMLAKQNAAHIPNFIAFLKNSTKDLTDCLPRIMEMVSVDLGTKDFERKEVTFFS